MKVEQLIEFLEMCPDDAEIRIANPDILNEHYPMELSDIKLVSHLNIIIFG